MNSSDRKLKLLLIGRHELACRLLDALYRNAAVDLACVPARREDTARRPTLAGLARLRSIPVLGGAELALSDAISLFRPCLLVSAGYDRIVAPEVLSRVTRCVNVHFGMLPKYRGSYSIPWAVLNNDSEIGVTLHDMAPSLDSGAVIRQGRFPNDLSLSCRDLYDRAVEIGTELATWLIERTIMGDASAGMPQDERQATYYPPSYPGGFKVPWRQTATYVANYIRAAHFPPYDGAVGTIAGHRVVFDWPLEYRLDGPLASPGTVVECNGRPGIAVINGTILPQAVKFDNHPTVFADAVARCSLLKQRFA